MPHFLRLDIETIPTQDPKVIASLKEAHTPPDGPRPAKDAPEHYRDPLKIAEYRAKDEAKAIAEWQEACSSAGANLDKAYRDLAVKGRHCHIVSVSWALDWFDPGMMMMGTLGETQTVAFSLDDIKEARATQTGLEVLSDFALIEEFERTTLTTAFRRIMDCMIEADIANTSEAEVSPVIFNAEFDMQRLFWRCARLGIVPPACLRANGRSPRFAKVVDPMKMFAGRELFISQDDVLDYLGIEKTDPTDGSMIWNMFLEGKTKDIQNHNSADVAALGKILDRVVSL